jgi:uncharacterized glyoxalase superfamily metalloenzyme YdcJ
MAPKGRPRAADNKSLYNGPARVYTEIPATIKRSTVMAKRKTAEQTQDNAPATGETVTLTAEPAKENSAAEKAAPAPERQPGDDTKSWARQATASLIVDPEAGVKFHFDYERHKAAITFTEKPTAETLDVVRPILKEGKFHWENPPIAAWEKDIQFTSREQDRREAKKTFYAVANAIREQKGLPARSFGEAMAF